MCVRGEGGSLQLEFVWCVGGEGVLAVRACKVCVCVCGWVSLHLELVWCVCVGGGGVLAVRACMVCVCGGGPLQLELVWCVCVCVGGGVLAVRACMVYVCLCVCVGGGGGSLQLELVWYMRVYGCEGGWGVSAARACTVCGGGQRARRTEDLTGGRMRSGRGLMYGAEVCWG